MADTPVSVRLDDGQVVQYEGVPDGVTPEQVEERALKENPGRKVVALTKGTFEETPGGAAVGNPNISSKAEPSLRPQRTGEEALTAIGGATGIGAALGAVAPELLKGAGMVATRFAPQAAPFLINAGEALRGKRIASTGSGALSGFGSETAGQAAEHMGAGPWTAFGARVAGGMLTPEVIPVMAAATRTVAGAPYVSDAIRMVKETYRKMAGKDITLSAQQEKAIAEQVELLRGGSRNIEGKTEALDTVGGAMGSEGSKQGQLAAIASHEARLQRNAIGRVGHGELRAASDIGDELRNVIVPRNEAAIAQRRADYEALEKLRDDVVANREAAGKYISSMPEYQQILAGIDRELDNSKVVQRSPEVQAALRKVRDQIAAGADGQPMSFQAIDDVRRKLGEVFRGAPSEGYEALNDARGRQLYAQLTDLQKKFTGGDAGPHARLLEDYHAQSEALKEFRGKGGRAATAVDKWNDEQFKTDAAALPANYFKTRDTVRELKQLVGNDAIVNRAAMDFVDNQITGKDAAAIRAFTIKNRDWIREVPMLAQRLENHTRQIEIVERATRQAELFVKTVDQNRGVLTKGFPAERAKNLINGGTAEDWAIAGPAIAKSPAAKEQLLTAVRHVLADRAEGSSSGLADYFSMNLRRALESTNLIAAKDLDFIAQRLAAIEAKQVPEQQKLGVMKRLILQAVSGTSAAYGANVPLNLREKSVPD